MTEGWGIEAGRSDEERNMDVYCYTEWMNEREKKTERAWVNTHKNNTQGKIKQKHISRFTETAFKYLNMNQQHSSMHRHTADAWGIGHTDT